MTPKYRVAIFNQPVIAKYQVPMLRDLIIEGRKHDIEIDVYTGEDISKHRQRGDYVLPDFVKSVRTRELFFARKSIFLRSISEITKGEYDLIILEQAVRNLETYILILRKLFIAGSPQLAFWGHGKTYSSKIPRLQEKLKYWLTRRGIWFFGYTSSGVQAVIEQGFPQNRTTTLVNSIDTTALRRELSEVSDSDIAEFENRFKLKGKTALYIGALDSYKRIPFLLESAELIHRRIPEFKFLIAGDGEERNLVQDFVSQNNWAMHLGYLSAREKAMALKSSQVILIPGAIGLVALDSLVSGVPVITTEFELHGPEFEYLENGITCIISKNEVSSYALSVSELLNSPNVIMEIRQRCLTKSEEFSHEHMVDNFVDGLIRLAREHFSKLR